MSTILVKQKRTSNVDILLYIRELSEWGVEYANEPCLSRRVFIVQGQKISYNLR